ncbi:unnamed protein product, partial [Mesorhabditis belari]|uniref:Uncharacterized protein n=1 Tax=Mesorhabditis belari TaxID=2138241 RepID=A0AAF3EX24_9BILA
MAQIEQPPTRSSPFFSLFRRSKKKINGTKSHDDFKTTQNAIEELAKTKPSPQKMSFTDRVKAHKTAKSGKKDQSSTLPSHLYKKHDKHLKHQCKSQSFDALVEEDPVILIESLQTIADEQPTVARSIPKHANIKPKPKDPLRNCLFEQEVYDTMLSDSLKVCDLLAAHLDDCITHVRAKSPELSKMNLSDVSDGRDSGRGPSSASSTISTSPTAYKRPLKSCVRADFVSWISQPETLKLFGLCYEFNWYPDKYFDQIQGFLVTAKINPNITSTNVTCGKTSTLTEANPFLIVDGYDFVYKSLSAPVCVTAENCENCFYSIEYTQLCSDDYWGGINEGCVEFLPLNINSQLPQVENCTWWWVEEQANRSFPLSFPEHFPIKMAQIEQPPTRSSPFFSLFRRSKKKINGTKSHDDFKTTQNAIEELAKTKPSPQKMSFTDRVKAHKTAKSGKKDQSSTLPSHLYKKHDKHLKHQCKSQSFDALVEEDPVILIESLQTIADEQPTVARSIPKHANIKPKPKDPLRNCLFEQEVYDTMLSDSLKVCDLLAAHLDDCITHVRAKSPELSKMNLSDVSDGRDSGRGPSSASSTISTSPTAYKRPLKSCVRADL